jgi:hypothetical protein
MGWIAVRTHSLMTGWGTSGPVDIAGREATVKVCGVTVGETAGA